MTGKNSKRGFITSNKPKRRHYSNENSLAKAFKMICQLSTESMLLSTNMTFMSSQLSSYCLILCFNNSWWWHFRNLLGSALIRPGAMNNALTILYQTLPRFSHYYENNQFIITFILHNYINLSMSINVALLTSKYHIYTINDMSYNFSWSITAFKVTINLISSKIMTNPGFNKHILNGHFWRTICNIKWISIMCTVSTVEQSKLLGCGILTSRVTQF